MSADVPGAQTRFKAWRTLALLVSLMANLFLAGVLLGRAWPPAHAAASVGASAAAGLAARVRALPSEDRLRFSGTFARHRPEIRAARAELRLKAEAARAALGATPYDQARAQAAFVEVRAASGRLQAALQTALAESVSELSPGARAGLAAPSPPSGPPS